MSVIEIVSLACLFILFLIMFFVVKNHLVLIKLGQQRAEQDGVTIGFLVIEFFHAYASKYNIQRRKLSSAKRKHYQFSFSHP